MNMVMLNKDFTQAYIAKVIEGARKFLVVNEKNMKLSSQVALLLHRHRSIVKARSKISLSLSNSVRRPSKPWKK